MATPTNRSVIRAFSILDAFRCLGGQGTAREIARCAGIDQATAHRFIATLEQVGAITRDRRGKFSLGMTLLDLGDLVPSTSIICNACESSLASFAERCGETLHVGVFEAGMVTYLYKARSIAPSTERTQIGSQLEAYGTGLGKVLLAHLPESDISDYLSGESFVALTENTITAPERLRNELTVVRERAYAVDHGETYHGVHCVAVPIRSATGKVIAALSCTGPAERMPSARLTSILPDLFGAAAAVSARLYSHTMQNISPM